MNSSFLKVLESSCFQVGKDMQIHAVQNADKAFEIYNDFILDGMPDEQTKEIVSCNDSKIVWKKLTDTHEPAWKKAGGNLNVYYMLQKSFVTGLFDECKYAYYIEDNLTFSLFKL